MNQFVRVLLGEKEQETISVVSLSLAAIPECKLHIAGSTDDVLFHMEHFLPDLLLLSQGLPGRDLFEVMKEIRSFDPTVYMIVSLTQKNPEFVNQFFVAGANDCISKDQNYVANLMNSVKRAVTRISERQALQIAPMNRADQLAMDENLPDVVLSLDREGKILYVNRAVSTLLGYEQKDLLNRSFSELISSDETRQQFAKYLEQVDYETNFRRMIALQNSLGIEEDFEVNFTLMEGEVVYGVARKEGLQNQPGVQAALSEELDTSAEGEPIPARLGPYQVVTLLGAGGMGRVYKGFDEHLERNVAIKVVSQNYASTEDHQQRFHREARILASICHPNIALIYYYGVSENLSFFCMEYLPGGSLEDLLSQKTTLSADEAISFAIQVAMGLKEAFAKGIIHLDIKPSNLMLAEDNRIKIVDFGLARKNRDVEGAAKWIIGTPLYVAPEQLSGSIDYRCDIYSLGITLFQMVYGRLPYTGSTTAEVFSKKLHDDFPPREILASNVPKSLYDLIVRMTAKDPARRISDYSELISDLENVRRSLNVPEPFVESQFQSVGNVVMQGNLYDRPFAEVLGEIASRRLSGKLTLSWIDLYKTLHFRDGQIIAVLSSQEGENFVDLVLAVAPGLRKKLPGQSSDLFHGYSTAMEQLSPDSRETLSRELKNLATRILEGLFSWYFGDYLFEEGEFPGQMQMELETERVLEQGIRKSFDAAYARRKLLNKSRIRLETDFRERISRLKLNPSDCFLLFRFENRISYSDLFSVTGLPEDEFNRLLYLFYCLGLIRFERLEDAETPPRKPTTSRKQPPAAKESPSITKLPPSPAPKAQAAPVTDLAAYYFRYAQNSFDGKNYWACVEYCKKALELRKDPRIYRLMGNALATHPRFRHEAMDAFNKAHQMDPSNAMLESDIADLFFVTENYALAKSRYQSVLKLDPANIHAEERLAEIRKKKR